MYSTTYHAVEANKVLRNTFATLALTMITTVIGAMIGIEFNPVVQANPMTSFIVMLVAAFGLLGMIIMNRNNGFGLLSLFMFTVVMGFSLGGILDYALALKNGHELIALAFAGTATSLAVMSSIAIFSKKDFSYLGAILFGSLVILVVIELLNAFIFQAPGLMVLSSIAGAIIFSLYILYDVNQIVRGHETNYIMATTSIYLDVLNLFIDLLRLLISALSDD